MDRYMVSDVDDEWCTLHKFTGHQLQTEEYKVRHDECIIVPSPDHNLSAEPPHDTRDFPVDNELDVVQEPPGTGPILEEIVPDLPDPEDDGENYPVLLRKYPTTYHLTHLWLLYHRRKLMLLDVLDIIYNNLLT